MDGCQFGTTWTSADASCGCGGTTTTTATWPTYAGGEVVYDSVPVESGCASCQSGYGGEVQSSMGDMMESHSVIETAPAAADDAANTFVPATEAPVASEEDSPEMPPAPAETTADEGFGDFAPVDDASTEFAAPEAAGDAGLDAAPDSSDDLGDMFGGADDAGFDTPPAADDGLPAGDALPADDGLDGFLDDAGMPETPADDSGDLGDLFDASHRPHLRWWTDNTGQFRTEGRLVEVQDEAVRLLKTNGKFCTVPRSRLSAPDRNYVLAVAQAWQQGQVRVAANR